MKKRTPRPLVNPMAVIAARTRLTESEHDAYALPAHLYLAIVLDGKADDAVALAMTRHLVMLQIVAADQQNRPLYDMTAKAIQHWQRASELAYQRGTSPDLSTTAKRLLTQCICDWDYVLSRATIGLLSGAARRWQEIEAQFSPSQAAA